MKFSLWYACLANLTMGIAEILLWVLSGSSSLLADSVDFIVDGLNYGSSIWALKKSEKIHHRLAHIKGVCMILAGITTLIVALYNLCVWRIPTGEVLGVLGFVALAVNLSSAWLLARYRDASEDLRAVWLCTRNDAIGNILVIIAGIVTMFSPSPLPDAIAGGIIATLAISSGASIVRGKSENHSEHQH